MAFPGVAGAVQPGGMMGGGGMPAGSPAAAKDKKDGPAEEAPKDKQALQPIEPVPAQPKRFRRLQLFELHGYLRMRGDYFHRLDLGQTAATIPGDGGFTTPSYVDTSDIDTKNKFFPPPSKHVETSTDPTAGYRRNDADCTVILTDQGVNANKTTSRCNRRNGFASANMRLRLEPTLHVSDTVKVHAQIDALDNLVLGSTPDSFYGDSPYAPIDIYTRTQVPPSAGINSFTDSIVVKRAYGEIRFGWGLLLEFGRMPNHWGMGIVFNDGNGFYRGQRDDIIRQVDTDYGDSVDSLRFSFDFGKDRRRTHRLTFSWDWAASGPTTDQLLGPGWSSGNLVGQAFSAEKFDNVYQWRISILRRDDQSMLERKLSLGRPVFNYGFAAWVRYQPIDRAVGSPGLGDGLGTNPTWSDGPNNVDDGLGRKGSSLGNGDLDDDGTYGDSGLQNYANLLVPRRAILVTPDLWMRVMWRTLRIELEVAGVFGVMRMRNLNQSPSADGVVLEDLGLDDLENRTISQLGYALEFKYGFFKDRFHIGLDHGFATGDDYGPSDLNPQNPLVAGTNPLVTDTTSVNTITNFRFNPAYSQDLLLFRELMGTVSNAAYFRPWAAFYFFQNNFSARLDLQYAFAEKPTSTIGNGLHYGIEIDAALRYHDTREPIFFNIQYGVMFPLNAFNRTSDLYEASSDPQVVIPNDGDAKAAQTVQAQLGIKF
ncbi:MAG: TIGR04551 family protein [Nannocystaceae bacterium]